MSLAARAPDVVFVDAGSAFRGYRPRADLARFVELVWTVSGVPRLIGPERVLPNGVVELIINLGPPHEVRDGGRRTTYRRAWFAGLQQGPLEIAMLGTETNLVGVRFRPAGAAPFLDAPLDAITDDVIEIEGRGTAHVRELRERLLEATSDAERVGLVEDALMRWLVNAPRIDPRVHRALGLLAATGDGASIDAISRRAGVSRKHLVELFRRQVGATPKILSRILRFRAVIHDLDRPSEPRWADLAYAHGYADQAHLCRDFKLFAGVTPTMYRAARTCDPNHLDVALTSSTRRGSSPSAPA